MGKAKGCLVVLAAFAAVGAYVSWNTGRADAARRAAMTPAQLAADDSTKAAAARESAAKQERDKKRVSAKPLAEFALKRRAKDPESMQFRDEHVYTRGDTLVVCGEVNAKNSFGGYIGFKPFVAIGGAAVTADDVKELGAKAVKQMFAMCADK